ncbi:hypothetical protein HOM13_03665 [Candidatus Woesearchaeota archaeon]|nr:hypothetical protein [Candidatus Woesearchaeota archaeon]MBT5215806.1 hypothetical protein [Candidatus Woesearchaeota archaeon]MBT6402287.1 hypothetical protein [Candidatus Woesearchaeota archaeon]
MEFKIRLAVEEDALAISKVLSSYSDEIDDDPELTITSIQEGIGTGGRFVAEVEGKIVGCTAIQNFNASNFDSTDVEEFTDKENVMELVGIFLLPEFENPELENGLLAVAEEDVKNQDGKMLIVLLNEGATPPEFISDSGYSFVKTCKEADGTKFDFYKKEFCCKH